MIVTVTATIMDGTVIRWYWTESDAATPAVEPLASASRNGVRIGTYLHQVPNDVMDAAQEAFATLQRDSHADLGHLATHRRKAGFGPLVPAAPPEETPHA